MKNIIFIITIALISCAATTNHNTTELAKQYNLVLEKKYKIEQEKVVKQCTTSAKYVKQITILRDSKLPYDQILDWISESAVKRSQDKSAEEAITTEQLLTHMLIVVIIYNHTELSAEDIYNQQFKFCSAIFSERIKNVYEQYKQQLKITK